MQLLIIADDFTGALDVSVQFAPYDVKLKVVTGSVIAEDLLAQEGVDILVVDTETRHQPPQTAADAVSRLVRMANRYSVGHAKSPMCGHSGFRSPIYTVDCAPRSGMRRFLGRSAVHDGA